MTKVIISPRAEADIDDITTYLAGRGGELLVTKYYGLFDDVYRRLEMWPTSGPARRQLGKSARITVVKPYVMIYDFESKYDIVTIVRVVRGSRRITRRLLRE